MGKEERDWLQVIELIRVECNGSREIRVELSEVDGW